MGKDYVDILDMEIDDKQDGFHWIIQKKYNNDR